LQPTSDCGAVWKQITWIGHFGQLTNLNIILTRSLGPTFIITIPGVLANEKITDI
jgi:hypothetical protein